MKTKDLMAMSAAQLVMHAQDQQIRIEQLEAEVAELQINAESDQIEYTHQITALLKQLAEWEAEFKHTSNLLDDALRSIHLLEDNLTAHEATIAALIKENNDRLKAKGITVYSGEPHVSPTEHLSQYRDAVIEECISKVESVDVEIGGQDVSAKYCAKILSQMKRMK